MPKKTTQKNNTALYLLAAVLLLIAIMLGYALWFQLSRDTDQAEEPGEVACTLEAKICPDGTEVGRTGPNCEFAACPEEDTNDNLGAFQPPPAIKMSSFGQTVNGVEGSYCYQQLCVDKIGPVDLVREAQISFTSIPRESIVFRNEAELSGVSVTILDDSGNDVENSTVLEAGVDGSFAYTIPAGVESGDYYLIVFAQFASGGDLSYFFPVHVE